MRIFHLLLTISFLWLQSNFKARESSFYTHLLPNSWMFGDFSELEMDNEAEVERGEVTPDSFFCTSFQMATAPHNRTTPIIRSVVRLIRFLPFMIRLHRPS